MLRGILFFFFFYVYVLVGVDLRLVYQGGGMIENFPYFFRGWDFFWEHVSYPGGFVEYISSFLSQLFHIGWAGAAVVTIQAWLIFLCVDWIVKAMTERRVGWVRFVPAILMLILYSQYAYQFATTTAVLAGMAFTCVYLKARSASGAVNLIIFSVLFAITDYIAGGAYLLFAMLCVIYEVFFRYRWRTGLLYLLLVPAILYIEGILVLGVGIDDAFGNLLPFSWEVVVYESRKPILIVVYVLHLFLPAAVLVFGLWGLLMSSFGRRASGAGVSTARRESSERWRQIVSWYRGVPILKWFAESLILLVVCVAGVLYSLDTETKTLLVVDYLARRQKWPEVLEFARGRPHRFLINHTVNRALYHTGRLAYDMFAYPQHPNTLLLTSSAPAYKFCAQWTTFDTYLELGYVNVAEHELVQCLETFGERPVVLERLALVNMVKGNTGTARIYLGALSKTLFDGARAEGCFEGIAGAPELSRDGQVRRLRSLMVENDRDFESAGADILPDLLATNRKNRMAFEYLMAHYLLTGHIEKVAENLYRLDDFDYAGIPRLYEEAILLYEFVQKKKADLHGRQVSGDTRFRFGDFFRIYAGKYRSNKKAAFKELAGGYGDSYLFYYIYGFSGAKR